MGNSDLFLADFSHFGPVLANLEDFLTKKEKKNAYDLGGCDKNKFLLLLLLSLIFWTPEAKKVENSKKKIRWPF